MDDMLAKEGIGPEGLTCHERVPPTTRQQATPFR